MMTLRKARAGWLIAAQPGLDAAHLGDYAGRDQTRREHLLEIQGPRWDFVR
jgi:hypothetical protein